MQSKILFKRSTIFQFFSQPSLLVFALLFYSCNPYKFATVSIDEATLNSRLDNGAQAFVLQYHGEKAEKGKQPLQLISYAYIKKPDSPTTTVKDLLPAYNSKARSFKGSFYLGNNTISRVQIERLLNDSVLNKRMRYESVLFIPMKDTATGYIKYRLQVVANSQMSRKDPVTTEPCPPAICGSEF